MPTNQTFDYLPVRSIETYPLNYRVVRFLISENTYETIITNLDREEFLPSKIKELFRLRWGIEQQKFSKYTYQINFTIAIHICKYFLRASNAISPPNVEMLISIFRIHYSLPIEIRQILYCHLIFSCFYRYLYDFI